MGEGSVVTWPDAVADPPGMSASWPLSTSLVLGALPGATPCARLHARAVLTEWDLGDLADAAELIVSELVTNAVRASTGPDGRPRYDGAAMPVVVLRLASDRHPAADRGVGRHPGRAGRGAPRARRRERPGPDARRCDVRSLALAGRPGLARQGRLGRTAQRLARRRAGPGGDPGR